AQRLMTRQLATDDPVLMPLLAAEGDAARDAAVERLTSGAQPLVQAIVDRYRGILAPEILDDVRSAVMLRILRRLRARSNGGDEVAIASFDDFVATLTFNCVNDVLRDRAPARTRLKNRIRYVLSRGRGLASWRCGSEMVAGLADRRGQAPGELARQ